MALLTSDAVKHAMDGAVHVLISVDHHRLLLVRDRRLRRLTLRRTYKLEAHRTGRHDLGITRDDRVFRDGLDNAALAGLLRADNLGNLRDKSAESRSTHEIAALQDLIGTAHHDARE